MYNFKKAVLAIAMVLVCTFMTFPAFAEEPAIDTETTTAETTAAETTVETTTETPEKSPATGEDAPKPSFQDRLVEAWEKGDISAIVNVVFYLAIMILSLVARHAAKKSAKDVAAIFSTEGAYTKGQAVSVGAINSLIDATNAATGEMETVHKALSAFMEDVKASLEQFKGLEQEKLQAQQEQIDACCKSVKCIGEMLNTTYSNSTTIPLPVKNLVTQKYIELCHTLGEFEELNGGKHEG